MTLLDDYDQYCELKGGGGRNKKKLLWYIQCSHVERQPPIAVDWVPKHLKEGSRN